MISYAYSGGLQKKTELFFFFEILDAATFRQQLVNFVPLVTSANDALEQRKAIDNHKKQKKPGLVKLAGVNIAFSHKGFVKESSVKGRVASPLKVLSFIDGDR